jgi:tRNA(fMet)-specific endonuclease VapC
VRYLFDTDHISFLQRRSGAEYLALAARIAQLSPADLAFSVVSFHEQVLGAHTFISQARTTPEVTRGYTLLLEILQGFVAAPVLPFDAAAAAVFDGLRAQRVRVVTMDLRIAAIALSRGLILVTRQHALPDGAGRARRTDRARAVHVHRGVSRYGKMGATSADDGTPAEGKRNRWQSKWRDRYAKPMARSQCRERACRRM